LGAREASVVLHDGVFHLFYDGAKANVGWRACLATSADLKTWKHHGPILELGNPEAPDSATATSPWFYHEDGLWHSYYLGCQQTTPPPNCVPSPPYLTCKAEATSLTGPWRKRYDVVAVRPAQGTYYGETACPGWIFKHEGQYRMFFSAAQGELEGSVARIQRTLGLLSGPTIDGPWTVPDKPALPVEEQIENSSVYFEPDNGYWFLFTNHVGIDERGEYTDAIWVYWSKDPRRWDPAQKAVVFDGENCNWSHCSIGMPSVVKVGDRLALFYDAPGSELIDHMRRNIGLAWMDLPLAPP
jgi:predicted GH43/DUF377 family glycosyl hydrolase